MQQQQLLLNTLKVVSCCLSDFGEFIAMVDSSGSPWKLVPRRFLEIGAWGFGVGIECPLGCFPVQHSGGSGEK